MAMYSISVDRMKTSRPILVTQATALAAGSGWLSTIACVSPIALLMFTVTGFSNPDWYSYQIIFEDDGGWLSEQGRDPLFLLVVTISRFFFGPEGYSSFRTAIAIFFILFTVSLYRGYILSHISGTPIWHTFIVAILVLGGTRFVIQIREGLALCIVLLALRPIWETSTKPPRPVQTSVGLAIAAAVHGGMLFLLGTFIFAWLLDKVQWRRRHPAARSRGTMLVSLLSGALIGFIIVNSTITPELVDTYAPREAIESRGVLAKTAFWGLIAICSLVIANEAQDVMRKKVAPNVLRNFVSLLGVVVLPLIMGMQLTLVVTEAQAVIVSTGARVLHLTVGLLVAIAALRGGLRIPGVLAASLLLIDQVRVAIVAVENSFGNPLL